MRCAYPFILTFLITLPLMEITLVHAQEDIVLLDGTVLRDAVVTRRTSDALVLIHATGVATIPADQLPIELQATHFHVPSVSTSVPQSAIESRILSFRGLTAQQQAEVLDSVTSRFILVEGVGLIETLTVTGHHSPNPADYGYRYINSRISQIVKSDEYLIENNQFKLKVPGNDDLVDGDRISGLAMPDGTYEYVTTMGARRRIRAFRMIDSAIPQLDDFLMAMDEGRVLEVMLTLDVKCKMCEGQGFTTMMSRVSAGAVICEQCAGHGSFPRLAETKPTYSKTPAGSGADRLIFVPCRACGGTGQRSAHRMQAVRQPCRQCESTGKVRERVRIKVTR